MRTHKKIDTVNDIDQKEFYHNYLFPQKPLVIKGLAAQYPAGKKWTIDYLKNYCSDVTVGLFDGQNRKSDATSLTTPDLQMKFSEYLEQVMQSQQPRDLKMFLFNMFREKPGLRDDFPCPPIFHGMLGKVGHMFFGPKNVKVRIHQDIDMSNVLLTQFHGKKRVVLVAPKYSTLLYRLPFNTHSLIDLDQPDFTKYPGLQYIETFECILEPGDSLFMPGGYWHYITYTEAGFAVSYRKISPRVFRGLVNILLYLPFDKLMIRYMGERWLHVKQNMAARRANALIKKIRKNIYRGESYLTSVMKS